MGNITTSKTQTGHGYVRAVESILNTNYRIGVTDRTLGQASNDVEGFTVLNTTSGATFVVSGGVWTSGGTFNADLLAAWYGTTTSIIEQQSTLSTDLVGFWPLNEGTADTAIDSAEGNNGTWYGTPDGTSGYYSAGYVETFAGNFDGTTNYISEAHISALDFGTGDFSVSFWIYPAGGFSGTEGIVGQKVDDASPGFQIYHDSGDGDSQIRLRLGDTSTTDLTTTSGSIPANTWTSCVATRASGVTTWYINGVQNVTGNCTKNLSGGSGLFNIGFGQTWSGSYFSGLLNDIRLYNRALIPAEISSIYTFNAPLENGIPIGFRIGVTDRTLGDATPNPEGFLVLNLTSNAVFKVSGGVWVDGGVFPSALLAAWQAS